MATADAGRTSPGPRLIEIRSLAKSYRTQRGETLPALRGISLAVREGEFVTIVGPSGCGKSTLLKILAGLVPRSEGEVRLRETPVDGPRRDIGVVFQNPVLLPWRTLLQNALLPAQVQGLNPEAMRARARELIRLVGLEGFEGRYPFELSGGMQQRAAIVRALVPDPAILLMDEPFGALDAMTREQLNLELMRIWAAAGKTVLFVTHSIPEAVFLADRCVVLTARPGSIAGIVAVPLPRPRTLEVMATPEFGRLTLEVRRLLSAQGRLD